MSAPPTTDESVAALRAENERLRTERDRALESRELLAREVMPGNVAPPTQHTKQRIWLLVLTLALLGVVGWLASRLVGSVKKLAERPQPAQVVRAHKRADQVTKRTKPTFIYERTYRVVDVTHIAAMAIRSTSDVVAIGGSHGRVAIYDLALGKPLHVIRAHPGPVSAIAFGPDTVLYTAGRDGAVSAWDWKTGKRTKTLREKGAPVRSLAAVGDAVAFSTDAGEVLWLKRDQQTKLQAAGNAVRAVAIDAKGERVAAGGEDGEILIWPVAKPDDVQRWDAKSQWINALTFSPDGRFLASAGFDKRTRLWDLQSLKQVSSVRGHARRVRQLAFDAAGKYLLSSSLDRTVNVWRVQSGGDVSLTKAGSLVGHRYAVIGAAMIARGNAALTVGGDNTIRLWPMPPRQRRDARPVQPGELKFRQNTTGETVRIQLLDAQGEVLEAGLKQLAWFLRSGPDDRTHLPDAKLVKQLYQVIDHFGRHREIVVISGYRSQQFNKLRTKQSKQVAKQSKHMEGKAIDFRVHGVAITTLHKYVKSLKFGGLGFYPDSQFIHMDTGAVRYWSGN